MDKKAKSMMLLVALFLAASVLTFSFYTILSSASEFQFENFYFDMPIASNGPGCWEPGQAVQMNATPGTNCPGNSNAYDLGGSFMEYNMTDMAFQIISPDLTEADFCGGPTGVDLIFQIDSDKRIDTGVPDSQNAPGMPGSDYNIVISNETAISFSFWNSSANDWTENSAIVPHIRFVKGDNGTCSSYPSILRVIIPIADIEGNSDSMITVVSVNGSGPVDFLSPGFSGGGGGGFADCDLYNNQGESTCVNQSKQDYGLICKYDSYFGKCMPDFEAMPKTCDYFCGYCSNSANCSSFSSNRGTCKWDSSVSVCQEMFFDNTMDCSSDCMDCFGEYECTNKGPKDGYSSKCGWINDPTAPNGQGFCDYKEVADKKDCSKNCFACYGSSDCGSSVANCSWISGSPDWTDASKGNYSSNYEGFMGCVATAAHPEICFMPGDEDMNGMEACGDPACSMDPFCGYGFGGNTGSSGGGGGMSNVDCWTQDENQGGNQTACQEYNGTGYQSDAGKCFWHMTPGGGLCDPVFMQQMTGGMNMDIPPTPIGDDPVGDAGGNDWLDMIYIGVKESPDSIDFGLTLKNITSYSACKKVLSGTQNGTFIRYLDVDENSANGCSRTLLNGTTLTGFDYKFEYSSTWNGSDVSEKKISYKCSSSQWVQFSAQLMSVPDACFAESGPYDPTTFKGVNVLIIKKSDMGNPTGTIRILLESGTTSSSIIDTAGPFYYKQGSIDFNPMDCFNDPASCGLQFMKTGGKFMPFEECMNGVDDNGNGLVDCNDADCGMAPWCQTQYNTMLSGDNEAPTITNSFVDKFTDFAFVGWMTNEPSNGTLELYASSSCNPSNKTNTFYDLGDPSFTFDDYKPFHGIPLKNQAYDANNTVLAISAGSTYHYKTVSCDKAHNCAYSACLNFTTLASATQMNFTFMPPPQLPDVTLPGGFILPKLVFGNGLEEEFNGSLKSMNYTTNASFVLSNPNSTKPWEIELEGFNIAKAGSFNLTNTIFVDNVSDRYFIGLDGDLWQELSQISGVSSVKIKIPQTFDSANKIVLSKCQNSSAVGCQNVSATWQKMNDTYATNITNTNNYCQLINWSTSDPVFTEWKCPTSIGFSVFAVYMVSAIDSSPPSGGGGSGGGGGGGGGASSASSNVYIVNDADFEKGFTTELRSGEKLKFKINSTDHTVAVISFNSSEAVLRVESTPQQVTMKSGQEMKFEVTGDTYSDLYVKVNSLSADKISLTIRKINELIQQQETKEEVKEEPKTQEAKSGSKLPTVWIISAGAVVLVVIAFLLLRKKPAAN